MEKEEVTAQHEQMKKWVLKETVWIWEVALKLQSWCADAIKSTVDCFFFLINSYPFKPRKGSLYSRDTVSNI